MKKIVLPNRYRDNVYLDPVKRGLYKFCFPRENQYRMGLNEDNSIAFIDPAGGPFLNIGYIINRQKSVSRIYRENGDILVEVK